MPEAFALFFVFLASIGVYIHARRHAADPARQNSQADIATLRQHQHLLEERLRLAERERWDHGMVRDLTLQLEATRSRLATLHGESP